jgi:flagellar basal-body rod modification protein FlgD
MEVSPLNTNLLSQSAYSKKNEDVTGIDTFLTMLVAQLKNQDPLNPMQGSDFAVQLAQFSSLEQQFKTNDYLEGIQKVISSQEVGNVIDYIGKTIKTNENSITVKNGVSGGVTYTLEDRADVSLTIYDADGNAVRRIYEGWQAGGSHALEWDGENDNGKIVEDGIYSFKANAVNEQGSQVSVTPYITGEVCGVTYKNGAPYLMIGNQLVSPENIVEVALTNKDDEV